ncbi:MAG TPA: lysylphosphatidylglycerol synthase domain-containing protein [Pseudonocardiaceae bacterium]|jgi:hypothetical protein|nr:lysylphosphatidylglycerol synthase domain-containing protein [Pseudonocardiaceae bacterium]
MSAPPAARVTPPRSEEDSPRGWRFWWDMLTGRVARIVFLLATVGLGGYAVAREWPDVRSALADLGPLPVIGGLVAALLAMIAAMMVWRVLLAALGSPLPPRVAAGIVFVGQLGKYLPGSIWPVVAQMELASAHQVPRRRSATASVLTLLVSLLAGLLTALVTLPFVAGISGPYRWALLAVPALLVFLHPRVLNPVLGRLLRLARRPALEHPLTGRAIATALGWAFASWLLYGAQVWLLAIPLGGLDFRGALLAVGGFAFAWSVGFLVIPAPAGAGVREIVLIAVLSTTLSVGDATAIALVSRALLTIGDLLTASVAAWSSRRAARATRTTSA